MGEEVFALADNKNTFYLKHHINNYDIDFNKNLKFSQLQNLFQNAAGQHSKELGLGFISLSEQKKGWVLSRMKMKIHRMPFFGETVTVETWPLPPSFVEYERDFQLISEFGEVLVEASSRWCIFDLVSQRMVKTSELTYDFDGNYRTERVFNEPSLRIRDTDIEWEKAYSNVVRISDLDLNYHMNNTRYLEWVTDCFSPESLTNAKLDTLQIDYLNQVKYGETMDMYVSHSPEISYSKGIAHGKTAFLCSIKKRV